MNSELVKVQSLINSLTDDEDLRQELWLHFLSGAADHSLVNQLEVLHIHDKITNDFQSRLEVFTLFPLSDIAEAALQLLDVAERQVVFLLVLGLSVMEIAEYKGTSPIRVHQTVASIRASQAWQTILRDNTRCHSKSDSAKKSDSV
jgi:hypothetical protein